MTQTKIGSKMIQAFWMRAIVVCVLLSAALACAPQCAVIFCDSSDSFSFDKPDTPLKSLCVNGSPLVNVYNGPAEVLTNGRIVPLSSYNPAGLSQSFSPNFFKIYSSSSIGHESVQGNQDEIIRGACVIVPIFGAAKSSCVSFTVGNVAPQANPTQTSTPVPSTSATASPAPSVGGDFTGIVDPEPSAGTLVDLTVTPTPFATPSALPVRTGSFVDLTYSKGAASDDYVTSSATVPGADSFRVVYDIQTIAAGVVSLSNVAPEVESLRCVPSGEVRIRMRRPVWGASLTESYPIGAILALDAGLYGECVLKIPDAKGTRFADRLGLRQETTYLKILAVSGTAKEYTVKVEPSSFLAMFERAKIEVRRVNTSFVTTVVRAADGTKPADPAKLGPITINPLSGRFGYKISKGSFDFTSTYEFTNRGTFDIFKLELSLLNVDIEMQLVEDYTIVERKKFSLRPGSVSVNEAATMASFPIYAIPKIKLDKIFENLPPLDLGIYFEIDLFWNFKINLPTRMSVTLSKRYNSGRKRIVMTATGTVLSVTPQVRSFIESRPSETNDDPVTVLPIFDKEKEALVSFTLGIRPAIAAYISYFKAAVSVDIALAMKLDMAVPPFRPAFPSLTKKALAAPLLGVEGVCDTCHLVELSMDGVLENPKAEVLIVGEDPLLEILFSDGSPLLSVPLKVGCYLKEFAELTQTCGRRCCNTDVGLCEFNAELTEPTCSGAPTPRPTPTSEAFATPTAAPLLNGPVVFARTYTDPHLMTFDGLRYSCQAVGEFVLLQAAASGLKIQGRFYGNLTRKSASVTTSLAITANNLPTVQISVPNEGKDSGKSCNPVNIYWNGKLRKADALPTSGPLTVSAKNGVVDINLASGTTISTRVRFSTTFGCYLEQLTVGLGAADASDKSVRGLLGSPDGNNGNDWMDRAGKPVKVADGLERVQKAAYEYCTRNWCIRNATDSLFTYGAGDSHAARNECDAPFKEVDIFAASPALRRICGGNIACLIDGLATNSTEDAQLALDVEDEFERLVQGNTSTNLRRASSGSSFNDPIDLGDARVGSVVTFFKSVTLKTKSSSVKEDLYLVTDVTTSMSRAIATVREQFDDIVRARAAASTDVAFGIGMFGDETYNGEGFKNGFRNVLAVTKNLTAVHEGVDILDTRFPTVSRSNFDDEEAGLTALYEIATSPAIKWRSDARRIIAYMADNAQHEPVCLGNRVLRRNEVIAALKRKGISVIMIDIPSFFSGSLANTVPGSFNCTGEESAPENQALNITSNTNGAFLISPSNTEVVEVLNQGIGNLTLSITADTKDCEGKFGVEFSPTLPIEVRSQSKLNLQVTVSVKAGACENKLPKCAVKLLASRGLLVEQSVLAKSIIGCA